MIKDTVVMLSERPNVRVHNDPLRMCPARKPFRARNARGALSSGYPFFGHAKKGYKMIFENCLFISLLTPKGHGCQTLAWLNNQRA